MPLGLRDDIFKNQKPVANINHKHKKKMPRVKSVNVLRQKKWDDRFIYNKIPEYDSSKDKNVLINLRKKYHSRGNSANYIDNSFYLYRPLSNKITSGYPFINGKNNITKTTSAKTRDMNFRSYKTNDFNYRNFLLYDSYFNNNKIFKKNAFSDRDDINNINNINMINLNNINKLWDELDVSNNYRKLFCVIYKELDDEDKEDLYQREVHDLTSIKNDISSLINNIQLRQKTINEIYELNSELNSDIINKNDNSSENIINEISDKIEELREHTIKVCQSMKKLKLELNGIKNLDKYDINIISEKYNFDKNYLIKMKSELNFLKEGFAKYYFNINNDQTPFLLKTSERKKINNNDNDPYIHLIPLKKELKNDIMECTYYIYQELIAYQNEKVNKRILRSISPLKRILKSKENQKTPNNINDNKECTNEKDDNNINIKISIINNNNDKKNNNNLPSSSKDNYNEKIEDGESEIKVDNKDIEKNNKNNIIILDSKNNVKNKNDKNNDFNSINNNKNTNKSDYKNMLRNYKINDIFKNNQGKSGINDKKNSIHIDKIIIKKEEKNKKLYENNKKNEENDKISSEDINEFEYNKNDNKI